MALRPVFSISALCSVILLCATHVNAQDRRPCVSEDSPRGCVGFQRGPQIGMPDPDARGIAPLKDAPLVKAFGPIQEWVPPADAPKDGTVTVTPGTADEQLAAPEQPAPPPE